VPFDFATTPIVTDITIYAHWAEIEPGDGEPSLPFPDIEIPTIDIDTDEDGQIIVEFPEDWEYEIDEDGNIVITPPEKIELLPEDDIVINLPDGEWEWEIDEDGNIIITPPTRTVQFNLQNGEGEFPNQYIVHGLTATRPTAEPERLGHEFVGWYVDGTVFDFTTPIVADTTIYAVWVLGIGMPPVEVDVHTVEFNLQGGVAHEAFADQIILHGELATEPTITPERLGHEFVGWYVGETAFDFATPIVANTTIYARWSAIQNPDDNQSGSDDNQSGSDDNQSGGSGTPPPGGDQPQTESSGNLQLPQTGATTTQATLGGLLLSAMGILVARKKKETTVV